MNVNKFLLLQIEVYKNPHIDSLCKSSNLSVRILICNILFNLTGKTLILNHEKKYKMSYKILRKKL